MRLLLNLLTILAMLTYAIYARRNFAHPANHHGSQISSDNSAITAKQLTAIYKVSSPKDMIQEMVSCNVTFFPLDSYQKKRKLRRKLKKYYYRQLRKWKKQRKQKKLKNKLKNHVSNKQGRSMNTNEIAVNGTMNKIIASNADYFITEKLFEGDIIVSSEALKILKNDTLKKTISTREFHELVRKSTTTDPQAIWPTTIPYTFDVTVAASTRSVIEAAITKFQDNTCLTFQSRNSEVDYLEFTSTLSCSSFVGRTGGAQPVSLSPSCVSAASAEHEIAHALGLFHMHSRHDRESYIQVNTANILPTALVNFDSYDHTAIDHKNLEYDYKSVMHYGEFDFTGNSQKTVQAHNSASIGVATGLSYLDIVSINLLYNCHEHTPHYWNFDSFHPSGKVAGTTVVEKHGSGGSGDKIELVQGQRKNALHISGSYYLNLGNFPNRCIQDPSQCTNGLSVMFWFKLNSLDQTVFLLSSTSSLLNTHGLTIAYRYDPDISDEYFDFNIVDSGKVYLAFVNFAADFLNWQHIGMVWNRQGVIQVYLNGVEVVPDAVLDYAESTSTAAHDTILVGKEEDSTQDPAHFQIDDLVIYEKPVSAQTVLNVKNSGPYHDKPSEEGSGGHVDTIIPQLGVGASIPWV